MNYLVCIKQVIDSSQLQINADSGNFDASKAAKMISSYDKNALEAAVQLKESSGGKVTALSLGSDDALKALKECISVGADEAVLISENSADSFDAYTKAALLSAAIKQLGDFDMIFCGKQATDDAEGQVGPQIAEKLAIPHVSFAAKIEQSDHNAVITREADDGLQVIHVSLPVLVTASDVINEPRFATIKSKMAANRVKIKILHVSDLESETKIDGIPLKIIKTIVPPKKDAGIRIKSQSDAETAHELFQKMLDAKLV